MKSAMWAVAGVGLFELGDQDAPAHTSTTRSINGYAYYAYKRSALLRISTVAPFVMPRMFSRRDGNAAHQWRDTYRPRYQQIVAA